MLDSITYALSAVLIFLLFFYPPSISEISSSPTSYTSSSVVVENKHQDKKQQQDLYGENAHELLTVSPSSKITSNHDGAIANKQNEEDGVVEEEVQTHGNELHEKDSKSIAAAWKQSVYMLKEVFVVNMRVLLYVHVYVRVRVRCAVNVCLPPWYVFMCALCVFEWRVHARVCV